MKWLKSTTQKSWVASCKGKQVIIPQNETSDNRWLQLGEDEFAEISSSPVIASLIKAGGIMVLNEEPAELKNSVPALQVTNTQLKAELETAKARILELEGQLKNTAQVADVQAEVNKAVEATKAEYEKKLKELDEKATKIISDKDAEIAKLEKKLKKVEE